MNRSINNFGGVAVLLLLACACAGNWATQEVPQKAAPAPQPEVTVPSEAAVQTSRPTSSATAAKPQTVKTPAEQLKAWDKNLHFLKTSFTQTTMYDGVIISRSQGTLYYDQAKNALRLDTQEADGTVVQSAVTDKKKIFILDDKGQEVSRLSWQEWQQGQPNQALFDFGNYAALLDRHHVKTVRPDLLALTPKEGEQYTLYLTLRTDDSFPRSIKLVSGEMITQADLTNIQQNKPLPPATFGGFFK